MRAGTLREAIYVERRGQNGDDGYGNVVEGWARLTPPVTKTLRAQIKPLRGNEQLIAARATGVSLYEIKVRYSSLTSDINTGDRVVNAHSGETYNITASDPDERKRYLIMMVKKGGPTG